MHMVENIKIDLKDMGCDPRNWMELAKHRDQWQAYVMVIMNLQLP